MSTSRSAANGTDHCCDGLRRPSAGDHRNAPLCPARAREVARPSDDPMSQANVSARLQISRRRIRRIHAYMDANVLRPPRRFCCPYEDECRTSIDPAHEFREGIMSHVGHHYDLLLDERPLRIVVVGQEAGWPKKPGRGAGRKITLEERYATIHERSGLQKHYYTEGPIEGRNPHMRGTPPRSG